MKHLWIDIRRRGLWAYLKEPGRFIYRLWLVLIVRPYINYKAGRDFEALKKDGTLERLNAAQKGTQKEAEIERE